MDCISNTPHTLFQFYLSFENSLCADYITEKFFKVLQYNVIPVVMNGANMSTIAPPNSYIDMKDFANIKGNHNDQSTNSDLPIKSTKSTD